MRRIFEKIYYVHTYTADMGDTKNVEFSKLCSSFEQGIDYSFELLMALPMSVTSYLGPTAAERRSPSPYSAFGPSARPSRLPPIKPVMNSRQTQISQVDDGG